ncbi:MAG: hypothetical protein GX349_01410 [Firmicutes bacterium]|nr:hypothetical protein [Bacillota bacterium]
MPVYLVKMAPELQVERVAKGDSSTLGRVPPNGGRATVILPGYRAYCCPVPGEATAARLG